MTPPRLTVSRALTLGGDPESVQFKLYKCTALITKCTAILLALIYPLFAPAHQPIGQSLLPPSAPRTDTRRCPVRNVMQL